MNLIRRMQTLLSAGLRIFFFAAGLYAVFAMGVWEGWLGMQAATGQAPALPFAPPPVLWHAHEMIFGYACAVLGGFFLTAVPSWTGEKSARAAFVSVLAVLWLAGRLAVWWSGALDPVLVAAIDLAFLPVLGAKIGLQLARRPKPQNMVVLLVIAMIWTGNLMVHLDWIEATPGTAAAGLRLGLLTIAAMIAIIGGRVIPAFTRNAMRQAGRDTALPRSRPKVEIAGVASAILLALFVAAGAPDRLIAALALVAGTAQAARLAGWRGGWTLGQPILWSLHLGFAMLALGYLALAAAMAGWIGEVGALHLIGIGAIGGMTLAMMSRAALGHTGRALVVARPVAWAYGLVALAALIRAVGAEAAPGWYDWAMLISGALWLFAYLSFIAVYWPILTSPRQNAAT
ncbi:MAG: NnrS family protein [Alphaproteobacteria bacterium]